MTTASMQEMPLPRFRRYRSPAAPPAGRAATTVPTRVSARSNTVPSAERRDYGTERRDYSTLKGISA